MGDFIKTLTSLIGSIKAKVDGKIGILQKRIDDIPTETVLYTPQTLTEEQQKQARDNIGANDDAGSMFVTITKSTQNGVTVYSADKTYDEIMEAVKNGIVPVCNNPVDDSIYGPKNVRCIFRNSFYIVGMEYAVFQSDGDEGFYKVVIYKRGNVTATSKPKIMTGATADNNGTSGTVPRPFAGYQNKFLRGDATWADVPKYELPVAANEQLGGVKPVAKTDAMTQDVGVDENGKLYTEKAAGGVTPDIQIGTVTTLDAGSDATASMSGTAENPLLNLGIPKGSDGAGMDITGAAAGQIAKITAVDENGVPTAWTPVDMPSGGGGGEKEWVLAGSVTAESAGTVLKVSNIHAKHILVSLYASCDETSNRSYQIKLNDAISAMRGSALPGNGEKHLWAVEFELLTAGDENYIYCRVWPNEAHHTNKSDNPATTMYTTTIDGTMWYRTSISEFNSVTFQSMNGTPSAGNIMNVWYR